MSRGWRLTPPTASENDIEAGCKTLLELHRYWYAKQHAGVFQTLDGRRHVHGVRKGTPDYACLHGRHRGFLLEVKRPGGSLSLYQQAEIDILRRQWDLPIVVVETPEELAEFLKEHERRVA